MSWLTSIENDDLDQFLQCLKDSPDGLHIVISEDPGNRTFYNRTMGELLFSSFTSFKKSIHPFICNTANPELYEQVIYYIDKFFNEIFETQSTTHNRELVHYLLGLTIFEQPQYQMIFNRCCRRPNVFCMEECLRYYPSRLDRTTNMMIKFDTELSINFWDRFLPNFIPLLISIHKSTKTEVAIHQLMMCLDLGLRLDVELSVNLIDPLPKSRLVMVHGLTLTQKMDADSAQNAFDIFYRLMLYVKHYLFKAHIDIKRFFNNICRYANFEPKDCLISKYADIDSRQWDIWIANYNLIKHWNETGKMSRTDNLMYHYQLMLQIIDQDAFGLLRLYIQCLKKHPILLRQLIRPQSPFRNGSLCYNVYHVVAKNNTFPAMYRCLMDMGANFDEYISKRTLFESLCDTNSVYSTVYASGSFSKHEIRSLIIDWLSKKHDSYWYRMIPDLRHYCKYFL